jgi:uncharacterized NAD(P)/FAD-binding protein YdhS
LAQAAESTGYSEATPNARPSARIAPVCACSRALAGSPKLLIADEPTGQLDSDIREAPAGLRVRISQGGTATEVTAGWLINATGPATDITRTSDRLLRGLFDCGLARPDRLRLGLDAGPAGAVRDAAGRPSSTIFTLGPTLRGLAYETTAIPEIRDQAAALARHLTAATQAPARPISAA